MLTHLICLGILGSAPAGSGDIIAVPERTVTALVVAAGDSAGAALPLGAYRWPSPFDPSDRAPYPFVFGNLLAEDEQIDDIVQLTMSAAGASVGVEIDQSAGREPIIATDGKAIQLWFRCTDPGNAAFAGAGVAVGVAMLIRTTAAPHKDFERTAVLTVRQQ